MGIVSSQARASTPTLALAAPASANWHRWFPNALTASRLVIAIAFFILLSVGDYPVRELVVTPKHPLWRYLGAAALFGLAAVTDALDGPLARRWKVVSKFGRVMDPFADKVLVVGAFVMLAGPSFFRDDTPGSKHFQVSGVYPWMVVLILGRELLVTSIRAVAEEEGHDFSAELSGKAKMILQACVIPFILVMLGITEVHRSTPGHFVVGRFLIDLAVWVTVGVTGASAVPYVARGAAVLAKASRSAKGEGLQD
jgi:CDP-diacylglycerol---glycerol-3-phosphate 3-phosphatidyltransferase